MCAKDFHYFLQSSPVSESRTCNSFAYIPVPSVEGSGTSVEGVPVHATLFNGPFCKDYEPTAEDAAVIEFAIREDGVGMRADGLVVSLAPAFLEGYYVGRGVCNGDTPADFIKSFGAKGGDIFEAPAVEREDVDTFRGFRGVGHVLEVAVE